MRLWHPELPGRPLRLAYCLNLHPADDLDGVRRGIEEITLPLSERVGTGAAFGVGPYLALDVALELVSPSHRAELADFARFLASNGLDAFTFNAFPARRFHEPGLKAGVFSPSWKAPERLAFTLAVAEIALAVADAAGRDPGAGHISISTHAGGFGSAITTAADRDACAEGFALCALNLARLEAERGHRIVLALEPEPRSSCNDTAELQAFFERVRTRAYEVIGRGYPSVRATSDDIVQRHLGTCLDACHAAVEFEEPATALANATASGTPLGKLQFSSALELEAPDQNPAGREALFALDEPVYLHQVTGRRADSKELVRATDLAEARTAAAAGDWSGCDAWRCHFHVPVDLERPVPALGTTRAFADRLLTHTLATPDRWGSPELHVEIETYTWDILPGPARGTGSLLDGLEREVRHVLDLLAHNGWHPAEKPPSTVDTPSARP